MLTPWIFNAEFDCFAIILWGGKAKNYEMIYIRHWIYLKTLTSQDTAVNVIACVIADSP